MAKKENSISLDYPHELNALKIWLVSENISALLGDVLTIIDASTEGDKNKAIKDLIRNSFSKRQDWLFELSLKRQMPEGQGHTPCQPWEDGLIPIDYSKKYSFID